MTSHGRKSGRDQGLETAFSIICRSLNAPNRITVDYVHILESRNCITYDYAWR